MSVLLGQKHRALIEVYFTLLSHLDEPRDRTVLKNLARLKGKNFWRFLNRLVLAKMLETDGYLVIRTAKGTLAMGYIDEVLDLFRPTANKQT